MTPSLTIVAAYDVVFLVAGFLLLPFVLDGDQATGFDLGLGGTLP